MAGNTAESARGVCETPRNWKLAEFSDRILGRWGSFPTDIYTKIWPEVSEKNFGLAKNTAESARGVFETLRGRQLTPFSDMILANRGSFPTNIYTDICPESDRQHCCSAQNNAEIARGFSEAMRHRKLTAFPGMIWASGEVPRRIFIPISVRKVSENTPGW